ncbi:MAG: ParB/RepB/Spo0J family partition protein [Oscillospiraceae bacterium]|nr:ParB/RepB/Spo0J family partition protein [Oscillospiraceae bacterium]
MAKFDLVSNQPKRQFNADDLALFGGGSPQQQSREVIAQLPLSSLSAWADKDGKPQPFRPYNEAKLQQLTEDIKQNGVLNPIIVRPCGIGRYQILAGHNRVNAARAAGLSEIPAMIRDVDDDTATLIMVNTNLNQRDEMLPSEKAWAYRLQLEAMKRQAGRSKENVSQNGTQKRSDQILAEQSGESRNQIQRYIRLTHLTEDMLEMVDNGMLPFVSGVALSYLTPEQQDIVCEVSAECDKRISTAQAEQIRRLEEITEESVKAVLLPEKPWNAANEFVSRSRGLIPKTATEADIEAVARLIEEYFGRGAETA